MIQLSDISGLTTPAQDGKAGNRQHTADKHRSKKAKMANAAIKPNVAHPPYQPMSGDPRKGTESGRGMDQSACYYLGHTGTLPIPGHNYANCRVMSEAKAKAAK